MRVALIGAAILCCTSACSQQSAPPDAKAGSRFTQEGLDAIAIACGLPRGSLLLDGASSVRFGSAVTGEFKKLDCVQKGIRSSYYTGGETASGGNELHEQEGDNAQAH